MAIDETIPPVRVMTVTDAMWRHWVVPILEHDHITGLHMAIRSVAIVFMLASSGCALQGNDGAEGTAAASRTITRTIVELRENASPVIRTVRLDELEAKREFVSWRERVVDAKRSPATAVGAVKQPITVTANCNGSCSSCDGADLWIFNETSYDGDQMCISGTGWLGLGSYGMDGGSGATWNFNIRSWYAGAWDGHFYNNIDVPGPIDICLQAFGDYTNDTDANGSCAAMASFICHEPNCGI
jgi:hypothetical protein